MDIEITGNETLEELEALTDKYADAEVVDELPADDTPPEEPPEPKPDTPSDVDTDADPAPADEEPAEDEAPIPTGIEAKDGEHVIPYDVLERERKEKAHIKVQLEASERLLAVRDRQLKRLGVAPEDLPENLQLTDEQLDALADDYPEIGLAIRGLVAKVARLEQPQSHEAEPPSPSTGSDTDTHPVLAAIHANEALKAWHESGGEQWNKAMDIDDQLRADPDWADKPLEARFQEVTRLTKAHFDQQVKEKAKEAEQKLEEDVLPNSPSEMGSSSQHTPTKAEQLLNADASEMQSLMADMSMEEIDTLLAQFSD